MRLKYTRKDYQILKEYIYNNGFNDRQYKIRVKKEVYSTYFGTEMPTLSFFYSMYDNLSETHCIFSYIVEDKSTGERFYEYSYIPYTFLESKNILKRGEYE